MIVLLEYFDFLLCIANLTGQDSQPCSNGLTLTICLMLVIMLRIMPAWPTGEVLPRIFVTVNTANVH